MRITFTAAGATGTGGTPVALVLGDDAEKNFIVAGSYLPALQVDTQIVAYPRAKTKAGFARKNGEIPLSWATSWQLDSYPAALKFIHVHFLQLRQMQKGDVSVSQEGNDAFTSVYKNALFQNVKVVKHTGVNVVLQYQFWAPDMTVSAT